MTISHNANPSAQDVQSRPIARVPASPPLPLPRVDMMGSREMQQWIARLQSQDRRLGRRNRYLALVLLCATFVLAITLWGVYHATIGAYAVLDDVEIAHHAANQARLQLGFRVVSPGKVYYRRRSGDISTEVIDYFHTPGEVQRSWSWAYEPGKNIEVSLSFRRGMLRCSRTERFPTSNRVDIVFLIDTTGSMSRSIAELTEKCAAFSEVLSRQSLQHRFALIGFGDAKEKHWLDKYGFTSDVSELRRWATGIKRFDGGDLPESALDALQEALKLPFDPAAMRRFYLVTDAPYHSPTQSGATADQVAERLSAERVILHVFCRREYQADYAKLLAESGHFQEIDSFGKVLSEGCILED